MGKTNNHTLKDIKKAIKEFPKVILQKEAAYKEREKTIKSFMKVSRALAKSTEQKSRADLLNPTTRFSDRVGNYVKYRPSYLYRKVGSSPIDRTLLAFPINACLRSKSKATH